MRVMLRWSLQWWHHRDTEANPGARSFWMLNVSCWIQSRGDGWKQAKIAAQLISSLQEYIYMAFKIPVDESWPTKFMQHAAGDMKGVGFFMSYSSLVLCLTIYVKQGQPD